jgi:hypothetical protein
MMATAGMPDMTVVSVTPTQVAVGAKVTWSAVVQNVGTAPTPYGVTIGIRFTVDNETVNTWGWTKNQLAAGARTTISAMGGNVSSTWTAATAGTHVVHAFVDDVNRFAESNESNNKLDTTFTVGSTVPATTTTTAPTNTSANGTSVDPPVAGSRDPRLWPFASDSVWNMPRGDGATFDSRSVTPGNVNINTIAYGVSVGGAGYPFIPQLVTSEQHEVQVQADGLTVFGTSKFLNQFGQHTVSDLRGSGINVTVPGVPSHYERATKMPGMGGPLRNWELQNAANGDVHAIKHAIALAVSSHVLNTTYAWPAYAADGFAGTNSGFMPEGGFMAIPSTATMPAGLNNVAKAVWQALHDYGAYAADATGPNGGSTDSLTVVEAEASADAIINTIRGGQITAVAQQLRWVTNASQIDVGGPGNRMAPMAPPIG